MGSRLTSPGGLPVGDTSSPCGFWQSLLIPTRPGDIDRLIVSESIHDDFTLEGWSLDVAFLPNVDRGEVTFASRGRWARDKFLKPNRWRILICLVHRDHSRDPTRGESHHLDDRVA